MADDVQYEVAGVYAIANLLNGRMYIGSSNKVTYRFGQHRNALIRGDHKNVPLQGAWDKYGEARFVFGLIEIVDDPQERLKREKFHLDAHESRNLYNICKEPQHRRLGVRHTASTRRKISERHKGRRLTEEHRNAIRAGMRTPEALARMSAAQRVNWKSPESNAKRSRTMKEVARRPERLETARRNGLANKGRKRSEEMRSRMSAARRGKRQTPEARLKQSIVMRAWWKQRREQE